MAKGVRGIIHVHSDFSRDGLCSIADLADFAREAEFQFVGLTDHAEDLTSADMRELRLLCEKHSDESLAIIPGLEYRCRDEIHILGIGITHDFFSDDPVLVASRIRELKGVAVLAHPARNGYRCPPDLWSVLHGIEIWNAAYDGRFVPPLGNLRLLQGARDANPAILGFGGSDLHWFDGPPRVTIELQAEGPSRFNLGIQVVMDCLRSGRFSVHGKYVSFDAGNVPSILGLTSLAAFRTIRHMTFYRVQEQ